MHLLDLIHQYKEDKLMIINEKQAKFTSSLKTLLSIDLINKQGSEEKIIMKLKKNNHRAKREIVNTRNIPSKKIKEKCKKLCQNSQIMRQLAKIGRLNMPKPAK